MKAGVLFVLAVVILAVHGQDMDFLSAFPEANVTALYDFLNSEELYKDQFEAEYIENLPKLAACPTLPAPAATNNVRALKPGHIKVVMAMGDSITAAMSAKDTLIISLKEYRGISYAIGGDTGITTFPNILKPYTTSLTGASTGIGSRTMATNGFNAGVSGAINSDMLSQAQWLATQLKANTKIDFNNDWKVLTIWIGSNNLCAVCNTDAANNGANFETNLNSALNYIIANIPRVFVNLVANLDISTLYNVNSGACGALHNIECSCVGSSDATKRAKVSSTAKDYQARAYTIASSFNARNSSSFAVVVQPFLIENIISDRALLSAADCFHPSAAGHVLASVALWNNMLTPAAQKQKNWGKSGDQPICPTADSIFPTN